MERREFVKNGAAANMIKALGKFFAPAFDRPKNVFHPTEKCAECGTPLMRVEANWNCPNLDCPAQLRVRLVHWCSPEAMNIPSGDEALMSLIVGRGLARDVAELYRIKAAELAGLPGVDKTFAQKFFDAIAASRKCEAWRLLFGLNIPDVQADDAKFLCREFQSVDQVFAASAERLMTVKGVSETAARSIARWHGDDVNRKLLRRLFKAGVNFKT